MFQLLIFASIFACGISFSIPNLDGRIYYGYETTIEEFPYIVEILYGTRHHCGGAVILPNVVITAAHCVDNIKTEQISIKYGVTNRLDPGKQVQIKVIHRHPNFEWQNFQNDIAILITAEPIEYSESTQPIKLPDYKEDTPANTIAFASGWGYTEFNEESDILRSVNLKVIARDVCLKRFGTERYTDKNICAAGGDDYKKDACGGDSGGPLVANNTLIGIVSWGYGCGIEDYPGVYTNVADFRDWIDHHLDV